MKITFNIEDATSILYYSFCNGGLSELSYSSVKLSYDVQDYIKVKKELTDSMPNSSICFEDVLIQILKSKNNLVFIDIEADETFELSLESALNNFNSLTDTKAVMDLMTILKDDGDADAYYCYDALQYALFGELIYG